MVKKDTSSIVLLTDFGLTDGFVGVMKGVIRSIDPDADILDLSHGVAPQNILQAAFLLYTSYFYFPVGSIFCVVVDPGVGSDRKAVCIRTRNYYFVGPDNGVLWQTALADGIQEMIHLTNTDYFLKDISNTFHGRDVFAPVAAHLSCGIENICDLGTPLGHCRTLELPKIVHTQKGLELTVLYIDQFGNAGLNIDETQFKDIIKEHSFCLEIKNNRIDRICEHYSQADPGRFFLIASSSGHMEISLKNGNAASELGIRSMETGQLTCEDRYKNRVINQDKNRHGRD